MTADILVTRIRAALSKYPRSYIQTNLKNIMTEQQTVNSKKILVTGSAGAIGQPVSQHLSDRGHIVRGFDRQPTPHLSDHIVGDLGNRDQVYQAVEGMDTVIHLAAYPNPADFIDVLLTPNVIGLHHVCEAAREFGVQRLILASTIQVVIGHGFPEDRTIHIEDGPAPVNHYALTKAWAEITGNMYARSYDMSVICVRIGWLPRNRTEAEQLVKNRIGKDTFFSYEDAKRFHERCVESPTPEPGQSVILFATSKPLNNSLLDLEPARQVIGYEAQDSWPQGLPFSVEDL